MATLLITVFKTIKERKVEATKPPAPIIPDTNAEIQNEVNARAIAEAAAKEEAEARAIVEVNAKSEAKAKADKERAIRASNEAKALADKERAIAEANAKSEAKAKADKERAIRASFEAGARAERERIEAEAMAREEAQAKLNKERAIRAVNEARARAEIFERARAEAIAARAEARAIAESRARARAEAAAREEAQRPITPPPSTTQSSSTAPSTSVTNLSQAEIQEFLDQHNKWRAQVGTPPLVWDETVAQYAQNWANTMAQQGRLQHSSGSPYGENIAVGQRSPTAVLDAWAGSEKPLFNPANNKYDSSYGHYTQVVWKDTTKLGCGKSGRYWSCSYNPQGNFNFYPGGNTPY